MQEAEETLEECTGGMVVGSEGLRRDVDEDLTARPKKKSGE